MPGPGRDQPLFTPSLGSTARVAPPPGERPWHIQRQYYVAFFGGPLAITLIASRNAARLGMPADAQRRILVVGSVVTGLLAMGLGWLVVDPARMTVIEELFPGIRPTRILRFLTPGLGLGLYLLFVAWQRKADRMYASFGGGEYDALLWPGVKAVFAGGLITAGAFAVFAGIFYVLR